MKKLFALLLGLCCLTHWAYAQKMTAEQYIDRYKDIAMEEMKRTGIPASITLAQGLIESGNGNSALAKEANNHFGIKCKKGWTGRSVSMTDDAPDECFRAYNTAEESYRDHSDFIVNGQRYAFLFDLDPKDYKGWARGLKQAGYATNPRYPDMLITVIEKYELYQYDDGNTKKPHKHEENEEHKELAHKDKNNSGFSYNGIPAYIVKAGDSYESITKEYGLMHFQLRKYNDLKKDASLPEGTVLYLKPKHRKAKEKTHVVQSGESMYYISQRYGIKLKRLYKLNRMERGEEPSAGETLNLRRKRKDAPKLDNTFVASTQGVILPDEKKSKPIASSTTGKPTGSDNQTVSGNPSASSSPDSASTQQQPDSASYQQVAEDDGITAAKPANAYGKDFHVVQKGETLYSISKSSGASIANLLEWNNIPDNTVRIGQLLRVGSPDASQKPVTIPQNPLPDGSPTANHNPSGGGITSLSGQYYVVQPGETLYGISKKTNVPIDQIKQLNNLTDNSLSAGQKLRLPGSSEPMQLKPLKTPTDSTAGKTHVVETGETLYSISKKYGITVEQLKQWNGIQDNAISIGQTLKVAED